MKVLSLILSVLFVMALAPGYYSESYFSAYQPHYYPSDYISPARTGLPTSDYFYPNHYHISNGWFRGYKEYTHAAYRNVRVVYAQPYFRSG